MAEDPESPDRVGSTRERIMRGTLRCVERSGVGGFSLEDVASESGVSRTSIYRYFPNGRAQLVQETTTWEVARFWGRLAAAVADLDSLEDRLVAGLVLGSTLIGRSTIMANLMDPDLDELADALRPAEPLVFAVLRDYMRDLLAREDRDGRLREGVEIDDAAAYLTRMVLSTLTSPAGVDLGDEVQARAAVRRTFLAGLTHD